MLWHWESYSFHYGHRPSFYYLVQCFNVRCTGSLDGETAGACSANTIKVKIIDTCALLCDVRNYCKIAQFGGDIRPQEASGTNALDIATTARSRLSTFQGNLDIDIEFTSC